MPLMGIPAGAQLLTQLHCLSHDGLVVMTAQRWVDPQAPADRPRSWVRLVRNGKVTPRKEHQITGLRSHQRLELEWAELAKRYQPTALTEDQMWAKLRELTGIEQEICSAKGCSGGAMPPGWSYCPVCGRNAQRVAAGSMSQAHRRGDIVMLASLFRKPR